MGASSHPQPGRNFGAVTEDDRNFLLVWLVFFASHFLSAPVTGFVLDDWSNLRDGAGGTMGAVLHKGFSHPSRPISMMCILACFNTWEELGPWPFACVSFLAHGCVLWILLRLTKLMFPDRRMVLLSGVVFAALPILSENIKWPTMVVGAAISALPAYAATLYVSANYLLQQHPRHGYLIGLCYGIGLFSYEAGALMPAALGVLFLQKHVPRERIFYVCRSLILAASLYALWRGTNAFGRGKAYELAPQFTPDLSFEALFANAKQIASWWMGPRMFQEVSDGFWGWGLMSFGLILFLVVFDLGLFALLLRTLFKRTSVSRLSHSTCIRGLLFFITAFGLAVLPCLPSYTASRLMYLPAFCLAPAMGFLLVCLMERFRYVTLGIAFVAVLGVVANQGTAQNWRLAGAVCHGLKNQVDSIVCENAEPWRNHVLVADTQRFRQVMQDRGEDSAPERSVYAFRNAGFLRGFAFWTMAPGSSSGTFTLLLDVEHPIRISETQSHFQWKARFEEPDSDSPWKSILAQQVRHLDLFEDATPEWAKKRLSGGTDRQESRPLSGESDE